MNDIEEKVSLWLKLPFVKSVLITQTVIYCVGAPIMMMFFIYPVIFEKYDIIKLLLLSISIGTVLYAIIFSTFCVIFAFRTISGISMQPKRILEGAGVMTNMMLSFYFFIQLIRFTVFNENLSKGLGPVAILFVMIGLVFCFEVIPLSIKYYWTKYKKNKKAFPGNKNVIEQSPPPIQVSTFK